MTSKTIGKVWTIMKPLFQRDFEPMETWNILTHNKIVWWSWGVNPRTRSCLQGKCIMFKPNGRYFKGFVCITLGWEDLYHVHFISNDYKLKKSIEGVYFDMLVDVIDRYIETQ
jgi:hypothetical protein